MEKEISYQFLEERNILIRQIHVLGSVDLIINLWMRDVEAGTVHKKLNGVITVLDIPDSETSLDSFKLLEKYYIDNFDLFGSFKMAQVIHTPVIAFAKIFEEYNPQFKTQSFSTVEGALEWMEIV